MGVWQDKKRKEWIYTFKHLGETYGGRARTKSEALAKRESHKAAVKKDDQAKANEKLPVEKKKVAIPTREEFLRIIAAAKPDERLLLVILCHTLARIDEILRLTWQDVNFERRTLTLRTKKNKAGEWKDRIIPMNEDLLSMLMSMWKQRKQETWVIYNEDTKTRYNRRPKLMRSLCKRAGVPSYGFHRIRHFVATYMHDILKIPTGVLSGLLGHEEKRTTEIYLHSVDEAHRQAMDSLCDFFDHGVKDEKLLHPVVAPSGKNDGK